ncbi:MAG TPA: hypothetical protein VF624_12110 [Tepidisphaeraceae bacterium]|jgi:hypothetical protein
MKYKTLARIALRLLGVYFIADSLFTLSFRAINLVEWYTGIFGVGFQGQTTHMMIANILPQFVRLAIGLYFFYGGRWVIDRIVPSNRPYCPECGYDLTRNPTYQCPECGTMIPAEVLRNINAS